MKRVAQWAAFAVVAALALGSTAARANETTSQPQSDRLLAAQVAAETFDCSYSHSTMAARIAPFTKSLPPYWQAGGWTALAVDAAAEAIQNDRPKFMEVLTRFYADHFTTGELKAGIQFLATPGGRAIIERGYNSDMDASTRAQADQAINDITSTADGRSYLHKLHVLEPVKTAALAPLHHLWFPAMLERLGEKADAQLKAADPGVSETDQLGAEVGCSIFPPAQFEAMLDRQIKDKGSNFSFSEPERPEWSAWMLEAFDQTFHERSSDICLLLGRQLTRGFSADDDQAMLSLLKTPAGQAVIAYDSASLSDPALKPSMAQMRAAAAFVRNPLGRRLADNMSHHDGDSVGEAFVNRIAPEVFRRFGARAVAAEAQRMAVPSS